ncbi:TlpA disulfide reductase family protein [Flavitalea sp. BT771]|uniref:TlpA family protein disulfide reductase n=1 Tax=Flavitalea sp. BT771 TaxID=3063329 RepID=UPI0026E2F45C|nr:TlpA disulfide reductase family protein [Flavitalea sp. BT771]MDO6433490.1 TlpA disulfide reductase family protein [Flavitalea sp. BT771]MDV6222605.1 TlpA disulfide reductase family protein [Flavitalea sp. BT771]
MKFVFNITAILCILSAVLPTTGVFAQQGAGKLVTVAGRIIHSGDSTPKVVKVNFFHPLKSYNKSARLDENSAFRVQEEMIFSQNMTVQFGDFFIYLYVQPGDSVHLTIDASKLTKGNFDWLIITGDQAAFSSQLNNCVNYLYKLPHPKYDFTASSENMLQQVKKSYSSYMEALEKYAHLNALDPAVTEWARCDIRYLISNQINDYVDINKISFPSQQERIRLFTHAFFDTHNTANFRSAMFSYHLANYAYMITRSDTAVARSLKESRLRDAFKQGVSILLKEPATPCRDLMIYRFISSLTDKEPALLDSLGNLDSIFTKSFYTAYLKDEVTRKQYPVFPNTPLPGVSYLTSRGETEPLPAQDLFSYLTGKYPGKVIYIDVYATWCGPCRAEFRQTPALHSAFEKKEVVFVNLCLESDSAAWNKMIKEQNLDGENYFLDGDAGHLFMGTYGLPGYPSYILVNKDGKIVTIRAPRPSEGGRTVSAIASLMKDGKK